MDSLPEKPSELVKVVMHHRNSMPSQILQHFIFNSFSQQPGMSLAVLVAELHHLSEHCDFGAILNAMLQDRPMCGTNDERIQRHLLAECTLDLKNTSGNSTRHGSRCAAGFGFTGKH
ncbi:hypothetical protein KIL84_000959 [Mauremys mutica]|uniref:Uncharacterized protein n=1 Tax=Mauremys mutica TaxID=74926 RepID=A0A9D3WTM3_9SAUR|nr:hypothetical protein KIL84_000959 [Mauremys mutica]